MMKPEEVDRLHFHDVIRCLKKIPNGKYNDEYIKSLLDSLDYVSARYHLKTWIVSNQKKRTKLLQQSKEFSEDSTGDNVR